MSLSAFLYCKVQELGAHQVGDGVVDRGAEEDDVLLEQPGVQVIARLAPPIGPFLRRRDRECTEHRLDHSSFSCVAWAVGVGRSRWCLRLRLEFLARLCDRAAVDVGPVDRLAFRVDDRRRARSASSSALHFRTSERTAGIWSARCEVASHLVAAPARAARPSGRSPPSTSSSWRSISSASATARSARSALTAAFAAWRRARPPTPRRPGRWPRGTARWWRPGCSSRCARSCRPGARPPRSPGFRRIVRHELHQGAQRLVAQTPWSPGPA